jgi:hypothetical protein
MARQYETLLDVLIRAFADQLRVRASSLSLDTANPAWNGLAAARFLNRPLGRVRGCHFRIPSLILTRFGSLAATSAWACLT